MFYVVYHLHKMREEIREKFYRYNWQDCVMDTITTPIPGSADRGILTEPRPALVVKQKSV